MRHRSYLVDLTTGVTRNMELPGRWVPLFVWAPDEAAFAYAVHDGRSVPVPDADERVHALRIFRDGLRETRDDRRFIGRFRGQACRFVKGMHSGAAARRAIGAASDVATVEAIFADFVHQASRPESARVSSRAVA